MFKGCWSSAMHTGQKSLNLLSFHSWNLSNTLILHNVKLGAVDRSTSQFWTILYKGHSSKASNPPFINSLKNIGSAKNRDSLLLVTLRYVYFLNFKLQNSLGPIYFESWSNLKRPYFLMCLSETKYFQRSFPSLSSYTKQPWSWK